MHSGNLYAALRHAFPTDLDATAIETCDTPAPLYYTWSDIERATARLANLFDWLELPAGARIAVHTDKSPEALLLYLAVLRAGHVYLPLNPAYRGDELAYFIENAEPSVLVCSPGNFGWVSQIAFQRGVTHVFTLGDDRSGTLLERAATHPDTHTPATRHADDLAAILYTSGTTGRSKGAMLTHGNLLSNARVLRDAWGWRTPAVVDEGTDVLVHALPVFHVHGLFVACHGALIAGAKMLWFNRFEPRRIVERLPEATVFMGVPTMYTRLLAEPAFGAAVVPRMRLFVSGSAPLLPETFEAFQARCGHTILERYGMSETVMLTSNPYRPEDGPRQAGTVGAPLPGVQLRIVDERDHALPAGETGAVQVKGPSVFKGYWRMPEKTAEDFTSDLWFRTGDVGRVDARGVLTLVGRSKDLVITGGYNVYPAEVESVLNALPGVGESAVVGVPHPDFGEGVVAAVTAREGGAPDPAALIAALKERLANFKVPKRIVVLPELPRNAMGKVQKNLLRERLRDSFA